MKTVYICFNTDVIHEGHLSVIAQARNYGRVIVGALCDEAMICLGKFPTASLEDRIRLYRNIDGVDEVVVQHNAMYDDVIEQLHPDYVIHSNNWR